MKTAQETVVERLEKLSGLTVKIQDPPVGINMPPTLAFSDGRGYATYIGYRANFATDDEKYLVEQIIAPIKSMFNHRL